MSFRSRPGLVEKLLDFAEKNPDKKIVEVRVAIGEFTQIEEEQLRFCYESIITEMPMAGSSLTIESVLGKVACSHCFTAVRQNIGMALCMEFRSQPSMPDCGKAARGDRGRRMRHPFDPLSPMSR